MIKMLIIYLFNRTGKSCPDDIYEEGERIRQMKKNKWFTRFLLIGFVLLMGAGIYLSSVIIGAAALDEKQFVMPETTEIYSTDGEKLAELYVENREIVEIEEIPQHVKDAFIAIEDIRFYEHQGIDPRAILRALYRDIIAGAKVEGGSTITQQLAKNAFLSNEKTILRKTKEVLIAMGLERKFSKEEILSLYLNQIYFGHGAYGIHSAAETYFNKRVDELTVDEAALLAGIPKAPSHYSPAVDREKAKARRDTVLSVMERNGFLTEEEVAMYQEKAVPDRIYQSEEQSAYYAYIDMVLEEAEKKARIRPEEIYRGGYDIVVPMNKEMQIASYQLFQANDYFPEGSEDVEAAFVMVDHQTGGIVAVQGGRNYVRLGLNRAKAKRQPGSVLKPLAVYAPALISEKYHPYSLLKDEQMDFDGYSPRNHNDVYRGEITMVDAMTESTNTAAVWLYDQLDRKETKDFLHKVGLSIEDEGLAVALGGLSEGVSPLELASAYTAFSNLGVKTTPYVIEEIRDRNGEVLYEKTVEKTKVMSAQDAWFMTRMLENVVKEGTATPGHTNYPLAGKTGTTSFTDVEGATRDAWFVGFTPRWTGALWIGYDKTTEDSYVEGGSAYPTRLFKEIINRTPPEDQIASGFEPPDNVRDLDAPVRLQAVDDLKGSLTLKGSGLFNVHLRWTPNDDRRVQYIIYEINDGEREEIGRVEGVGEFIVDGVNIFHLHDYMVVPLNPQTEQKGEPSNVASITLGSLFERQNEED